MRDTETVLHADDEYAPVAYLKCGTWSVEPKDAIGACDGRGGVAQDSSSRSKAAAPEVHIVTDEEAAAAVAAAPRHNAAANACQDTHTTTRRMVFLQARTACDVASQGGLEDMGVADEARAVLESMAQDLEDLDLSWRHVTMMGVYLRDMSDFAAVNAVYSTFLPIR